MYILDRKLLLGLFAHDRLKPAIIRTTQGNVPALPQLKQILSTGIKLIHFKFQL